MNATFSSPPQRYTTVHYLYRDAANWKEFTDIHLCGAITPEQKERIKSKLSSGEYFIPADVGLPELQRKTRQALDEELDHVYHELDVRHGFRVVDALEEGEVAEMTVEELVARFDAIPGAESWDVSAAMERLGI
ncbi:hypothetical protein F6X40_17150 [Paraburkholderia sp. UCT31]|uniref:hypothetical protein n=1 Tax=Paraburkholderia sp. UCT31 TaxID=2615209 RepID=UPI0016557042|nr:hypothetical protein [Paraburkholderia sp. UCT31]MBC8738503.1 hypothetical protein [Paraburkholderia sp. UCT31]